MNKAFTALALACMLGCGSVPPEHVPDGGTCVVHGTIDSCGPDCVVCGVTSDRERATCDGYACGVACLSDLSCTDKSCARLAWTFDSNALDGVSVVSPAGMTGAVRNRGGNLALAIEVTNLAEIAFKVPVCLGGDTQLQTRTLQATIFMDGGNDAGEQYYVQAAVPTPMNGAYLITKGVPSRVAVTYAAQMSMSSFANAAAEVTIKIGTFGAQFSGTIWVDDIKIE